MRPVPIIMAGFIAAALGAALWGIIGYYLHLEIGWIAIIIGSVVGMVCHAAAKDEAGVESGAIAATLTVAAILGGKLAMTYAFMQTGTDVEYAMSAVADQILYEHSQQGRSYIFPQGVDPESAVGEDDYPSELWAHAESRWAAYTPAERDNITAYPQLANPEFVVSTIADSIIEEWTQAGKPVHWPNGDEPAYAERKAEYPADVWEEAELRWGALDEAGRQQHVDELIEYGRLLADDAWSAWFWVVFKSTFGLFDIIFIGIGILAAFKLGAGVTSS